MEINDKNPVFFETVVPFVDIVSDGLIDTEQFLEASKCIVKFVDMFGIAFKPVKNDIDGNINKLMNIFDKDRSMFKHLNSIVKFEKETLKDEDLHVGTDALTWLNRALIYNQIFLSLFLEDYKQADDGESLQNLSEDLTKHFDSAYELTLKKYHGWLVRKIFSCCLMAIPNRTDLLKYLGYLNLNLSSIELRQVIIKSIDNYLKHLKSNTEAVSILLLAHGFQP
ncbi:hypothetical protein DERP_002172 [Dermatophagoides pteronyssinus]|uniref:Glycolipid transfer protein domain-containing protein n=1 Tax=Dermatophagoides pteronyssinus TaxID=6956 RepID=A0ABQ8JGZ0_DERPT|nr:hypothetical protein DERP_002172 [Dermatophagoides pteronyssinus]